MKVEWRREPQSRAVLEVEVPADAVAREVQASAFRMARRVRVPGFRPGKAPRGVLERYLGRDELYGEALEALVRDAYRRAVVEAGVVPVGRPEFDVPTLDETQPLRFVARVDVQPDVDPGNYRGVRVAYQAPEVTDADVEAVLEDLRRQRSRLVTAPDAAAGRGDFVLIRPTAVEGTERFQVGREVLVELGGGTFPPEVEAGLEGATAGEERPVAVGESGRLTAYVVEVKRRDLPPLDEAFAKGVANAASVDELRQRLRERLAADAAVRAREEHEDRVLAAVLDQAVIDLPVTLVEREIDDLVAELEGSLQRRGFAIEQYLNNAGKDMAGLRDDLRARAERRLRGRLVLDEIARREGLDPTEEEVSVEEEKVAAGLRQDSQRVREWLAAEGRRERLIGTLRRRKSVAFLVAAAEDAS